MCERKMEDGTTVIVEDERSEVRESMDVDAETQEPITYWVRPGIGLWNILFGYQ